MVPNMSENLKSLLKMSKKIKNVPSSIVRESVKNLRLVSASAGVSTSVVSGAAAAATIALNLCLLNFVLACRNALSLGNLATTTNRSSE